MSEWNKCLLYFMEPAAVYKIYTFYAKEQKLIIDDILMLESTEQRLNQFKQILSGCADSYSIK